MMDFIKSNKPIARKKLLLGLSILVVGITVLLMLCNVDGDRLDNSAQLKWREITPGLTTEQEVKQLLGDPDLVGSLNLEGISEPGQFLQQVRVYLCGQRSHVYRYLGLIVYLRSGKVWSLKTGYLALQENLSVADLVERYGKPEFVTWSRRSSSNNVVIYPEQGFLAEVRGTPYMEEAVVREIVYFPPMALDRVKQEFWDEMSLVELPAGFLEDLPRTTQDPWGFKP